MNISKEYYKSILSKNIYPNISVRVCYIAYPLVSENDMLECSSKCLLQNTIHIAINISKI
jgi:hypothetical protein